MKHSQGKFFTVPNGCPCAYSDAVLFAGSIVAFPHVCCGTLTLNLPSAQLLLQLLSFSQLPPQSWTFVGHITNQQTRQLR